MNLNNILKNTIIGLLMGIPFVVLIVSSSLFFPYITGKAFVFRILVEIAFGLWLVLAIRDKEYRLKNSPILWVSTIFLAVVALADIFSVNPHKSIWSNLERMEGLVLMVHLYSFFLVSATILRVKNLWNWFWKISLGVSFIVGLYGFSQFLSGTGRVSGPLGNSAYMAIYMLIHFFIALWYFAKSKIYFEKWMLGILMLFQAFILYYTATRGAILGLLVSLIVLAIFGLFSKDNQKVKKASASLLLGLVLFSTTFIFFKDSGFIQSSPVLSRFANISMDETTTKSRFMVWNMAFEGFKEKSILGWGQESFNYVFNKYYNPEMYQQEQWFDRTHNVFIDWLIAGGIAGFVSYIALFLTSFYLLWRRIKLNYLEKSILTSLLVAYAVHISFVFDNLTSYIMFFSLLAMFYSLSSKDYEKQITLNEDLQKGLAVIIILLTIFSVYFFNYKTYMQASLLIEAQSRQENLLVNLDKYKKAIEINGPVRQEVVEQLISSAPQTLNLKVPQSVKNKFRDYAILSLEDFYSRDSQNARITLFAVSLYEKYGEYQKALEFLDKSQILTPKKQAVYITRASIYIKQKEYQKAFGQAKIAFDLEPKYNLARKVYAITALYTKRDGLAKDLLVEGFGTELVDDDNLIKAYYDTGNFDKVLDIWKLRVEKSPNDPQKRLSLSAAYYSAGFVDKAISIIRELQSAVPNFKAQGDLYVRQMLRGEKIQ